ncbi:MAG TPA: hypothetical protein VMN58_11125 [Acidimicrobiales bacterium]|nr:hypothetical protein [Acidimicrobiales bacterium]
MTKREPRWWFVAYSLGLGALVAGAALAGGNAQLAVISLPLCAAFGIAMALTPWGTLRSRSQDEREHAIGKEAALVSYYAVVLTVILGFLIEIARGGDGQPWSLIGFVGGLSFVAALAVISRRR